MSEVEDLSPKAPQIDALKAEITFDEFTKMDLRVGLVLEASRIPKSDKLIHLTVDLGMKEGPLWRVSVKPMNLKRSLTNEL